MKTLLASLILTFGLSFSVNAQLPDGTTAPDFTLTDLNGTTHHLYNYLSQGKAVFIEFFACHCPSCWTYHNTGKLETLNQTYGPNGTDEIVVLMIEYDEGNGAPEFNGTGGWTQGDWVTGNSVPMLNVEGTEDRTIFTDYDLTYFTTIYRICPDKTTKLMYTYHSVDDLYQSAQDCSGSLGVEEADQVGNLHIDHVNNQLIVSNFSSVQSITMINTLGQTVLTSNNPEGHSIDLSDVPQGVYLVRIESFSGSFVKRVWVN